MIEHMPALQVALLAILQKKVWCNLLHIANYGACRRLCCSTMAMLSCRESVPQPMAAYQCALQANAGIMQHALLTARHGSTTVHCPGESMLQ
jgi:hypothetical protein